MENLINLIAQSDAPWWSVLAGTAIGGLITWLTTISSEKRKVDRELSQHIKDETLDRGLALIEYVNALTVSNMIDDPDLSDEGKQQAFATERHKKAADLGELNERLEMIGGSETSHLANEFCAVSMVLVLEKGLPEDYQRVRVAKRRLMNNLRALNHLDPLELEPEPVEG